MSVTCGFYNSLNGDRRYFNEDFSNLIDCLITDGVFSSVGTAFAVQAPGGNVVNVGIGRAWFNHTWTWNDSILPLMAPDAELLLNRIDAVILEVDGTDSVRDNTFKIITGTPASTPERPTLTKNGILNQYPLCYIYRKFGSTEITQADITNMIGTDEMPFVTGILKTVSLDELLGQWQAQLDQFVAKESKEIDEWSEAQKAEMLQWFEQLKSDLLLEQQTLDQWIASEESDFLAWYQRMRDQLSEDSAGNLQLQIDKEEIERILLLGFVDGSKSFSDDGSVITTTASDGRSLIKTFASDFSAITTVLKSATGAEIARVVKTFDPNGKLIDTVVTYL